MRMSTKNHKNLAKDDDRNKPTSLTMKRDHQINQMRRRSSDTHSGNERRTTYGSVTKGDRSTATGKEIGKRIFQEGVDVAQLIGESHCHREASK